MICYNTLCPFLPKDLNCKDSDTCNSLILNPPRPNSVPNITQQTEPIGVWDTSNSVDTGLKWS